MPWSHRRIILDAKTALELVKMLRKESEAPIVLFTYFNPIPYVDILQVGTRNMHNFELLKELGKVKNPVLLKRGFAATYQDLLHAAEYIISGGNPNVILCERGIRTFETYTRNTLDLNAIPALKELSHLPVIADPSPRHRPPVARRIDGQSKYRGWSGRAHRRDPSPAGPGSHRCPADDRSGGVCPSHEGDPRDPPSTCRNLKKFDFFDLLVCIKCHLQRKILLFVESAFNRRPCQFPDKTGAQVQKPMHECPGYGTPFLHNLEDFNVFILIVLG